jgi:hypothetical protein
MDKVLRIFVKLKPLIVYITFSIYIENHLEGNFPWLFAIIFCSLDPPSLTNLTF